MQKSNWKCNGGALLYSVVFIMLFFCTFYNSTTFVEFGYIKTLFNFCRAVSVGLIAIKCILIDKYRLKKLLLMLMLLMLGAVTYFFSKRGAFLDVILLMVASTNVKPRSIVKLYVVCASVFMVVAFVCSVSGIIVDYTTYRVMNMVQIGSRERHSFGINYSTDFAAHILYIYISCFYLRYGKKKVGVLDFVIAGAIIVAMEYYCNARFSEFLIGLSLLMFLVADHKKRLLNKRFVKQMIIWCFPFAALYSIGMTMLYSSGNSKWVVIDQLLFSKRLSIGSRMLKNHGLSLFGREIQMQGLGYKVEGYNKTIGTTYLDSSYMQLLLLYGLIATVVVLMVLMAFGRKVNREGNAYMKCIIILVAISCILNQYLLIISYNPFIIVASSYVLSDQRKRRHRRLSYG